MCSTFTHQCSRNHYDIFLIGTGSKDRSLFCLVSCDPFVWQVWGLCLLVPFGSGVSLPFCGRCSSPVVSNAGGEYADFVSI